MRQNHVSEVYNFQSFFCTSKEDNKFFGICMEYAKTIIHLSVIESGGYFHIHQFSPLLWWIVEAIVK